MRPTQDLADIGFDQTDEYLRTEATANLLEWSKAMFLCMLVEVYLDPIISEGRAKRMKMISERRAIDKARVGRRMAQTSISDIERQEYKPNSQVELGPLVYDRTDKNLIKRVKSSANGLAGTLA